MTIHAYVIPDLHGTSRAWVAHVHVVVEDVTEGGERKPIYTKTFKSSSSKHPDDKTRNAIGAELALGRALEAAGGRLQKIAWSNVPNHPSTAHPSMQNSETVVLAKSSAAKKRRGKEKGKKKGNH